MDRPVRASMESTHISVNFPQAWMYFTAQVKFNLFLYTCEQKLPESDVLPSFKPVITKLYDSFLRLSLKILEVMGYGLKLKVRATLNVDIEY